MDDFKQYALEDEYDDFIETAASQVNDTIYEEECEDLTTEIYEEQNEDSEYGSYYEAANSYENKRSVENVFNPLASKHSLSQRLTPMSVSWIFKW